MKVLIVGGVAGGASAATRLRRLDEGAEIVLFERGPHVSYANCGLPYYIGGVIEDAAKLLVVGPELLRGRFNIDVRVRQEVTHIDRARKVVRVVDHETGGEYEEGYDKLILSPGARARRVAGAEAWGVFTLRTVPDTMAIDAYIREAGARRAVVVGAGFIGVEMAENLRERGLEVTLVEYQKQAVATLDGEMAALVHRALREGGVALRFGVGLSGVEPAAGHACGCGHDADGESACCGGGDACGCGHDADGESACCGGGDACGCGHEGDGEASGAGALLVRLTDGSALGADLVVLALGVEPESDLARAAGLSLGAGGGIAVDGAYRTSDPDIFAVGDAINVRDALGGEARIPLAGPANRQGRMAAENALGRRVQEGGAVLGASVLKVFGVTAASVGLTERQLKARGTAYLRTYIHPAHHAGYYPGAEQMSLKLLFAPDGRVLGAQGVGPQGVDKRIDVVATVMHFGGTVYDLESLELCYAPPYGSAKDPVNMLGFTAADQLRGEVRAFHFDEVDALDRARITLLDVRTPGEGRRGMLEGARIIPVDDLRARLGELDKAKPVYVYCQVGLRGYIAARILVQHGFEVYNLSGGWRTYLAWKDDRRALEAVGVDCAGLPRK